MSVNHGSLLWDLLQYLGKLILQLLSVWTIKGCFYEKLETHFNSLDYVREGFLSLQSWVCQWHWLLPPWRVAQTMPLCLRSTRCRLDLGGGGHYPAQAASSQFKRNTSCVLRLVWSPWSPHALKGVKVKEFTALPLLFWLQSCMVSSWIPLFLGPTVSCAQGWLPLRFCSWKLVFQFPSLFP